MLQTVCDITQCDVILRSVIARNSESWHVVIWLSECDMIPCDMMSKVVCGDMMVRYVMTWISLCNEITLHSIMYPYLLDLYVLNYFHRLFPHHLLISFLSSPHPWLPSSSLLFSSSLLPSPLPSSPLPSSFLLHHTGQEAQWRARGRAVLDTESKWFAAR